MHGIIYKATNLVNGKIYVGQTVQPLAARQKQHAKAKEMFGQAIRKHGAENFCFIVIDTAEDKTSLNNKEAFWISFFNSTAPQGYNLTIGGDALTTFLPEVLAKMSASRLGKKCTVATRDKISKANTGKTRTAEARAKMSAAAKKRAPENTARLVAIHKGRIVSQATRDKMARAHTGRTASDETRAKLVEARKKRGPVSDEARRNMSIAGKLRAQRLAAQM